MVMGLGLSVVGCKRENAVLKISPGAFVSMVNKSQYKPMAKSCADYYIKKERIKVTRLSMVCAELTREMQAMAEKQGLVPQGTKLESYRQPEVWRRWKRLSKKPSDSSLGK